MLEAIYDNGYFKVVANSYENCYYVVNKKTGAVDIREESEPRALFAADGARDALVKHNGKRGEVDAAQ